MLSADPSCAQVHGRAITADVDRLVALAVRGLRGMYHPSTHEFVQTIRGIATPDGPRLVVEGKNLRYAAMVALGLGHVGLADQRSVLAGDTAASLCDAMVEQALTHPDPGATALTVWAAAETTGRRETVLLERLQGWLASSAPLPTVDVSWMLTAAVASAAAGADEEAWGVVAEAARRRLLDEQGTEGIFPHLLPRTAQGRFRAHVGSFADQVYPVQALARYAAATGDSSALAAANRTAARLCELQGAAGQWWWHYDARDGSVVERFPVYSVHQHAMAPMVLLDLVESGGDDHTDAVALGMQWLTTHPEVFGELVDEANGVVWRKVGRREPSKAVRKLSAVTTWVRPGLRLPGLDRAFPAGVIDRECRPYELGWLLYAWCRPASRRLVDRPEPSTKLVSSSPTLSIAEVSR